MQPPKSVTNHTSKRGRPRSGTLLAELSWQQAQQRLNAQTLVVIPLGAAAKEHGPHLKLNTDLLMADFLRDRLMERTDVIVAPTVNYGYYPAFVEYPGSTSLRLETARDLLVDIVTSLARHGPRRFYVLNTGISTLRSLRPAAEQLAREGILLTFTDMGRWLGPVEKRIAQQQGGTHADEIETSMMLVIAPETVEMDKAVKEFHGDRPGRLTRDPHGEGKYSPSGIFGDPTLASCAKGQELIAALIDGIVEEIKELKMAPLPSSLSSEPS